MFVFAVLPIAAAVNLYSYDSAVSSVAKTIPAVIVNLITSVANVFSPNLTKLYAQDKNDELVAAVKSSMKIMSIFTIIPNAILVAIGFQFYKLWIPSQPAEMIQILSVLYHCTYTRLTI